ncbi:hypothetical protein D3C85_1343970 [compost metagenome]
MVLDPQRAKGKAQQPVGQLPGAAGPAVHMAHQHFVIMLARHALQPAGHLPRPRLEQLVARRQRADGGQVQALHLPVIAFVLAQLQLQDLDLRPQREAIGVVIQVVVGHAQTVLGVGAVFAGAHAKLPGARVMAVLGQARALDLQGRWRVAVDRPQ